MSAPVLDLLRERRRQLGQGSILDLLGERDALVSRGKLIGMAVAAATVGVTLVLFGARQLVAARLGAKANVEPELQALKSQLTARTAEVEKISAANKVLAESLTAVRTSSVLLSDLQLRTPAGVQLTGVDVKDGNLLLKGRSRDPDAFLRINALQLALQGSPLLEGSKLSLDKVIREKLGSEDVVVDPARFELSAPFRELAPRQQLEVMKQLGSPGMERRLLLLQEEGLLP